MPFNFMLKSATQWRRGLVVVVAGGASAFVCYGGELDAIQASAPESGDSRFKQALTLTYEQYNQSLNIPERELRFSPTGLSLQYAVTIDQGLYMNVDYGQFDDDQDFFGGTADFTNQRWRVGVGYACQPWSGKIQYTQEKDRAQAHRSGLTIVETSEQADFMALSAEISREFIQGNSWLALSAFTEYQKDEGHTDIRVRTPQEQSGLRNTTDTDGTLLGISASASYLLAVSPETALVPSTALSWSEPLSGETRGATVAASFSRDQSPRRLRLEDSASTQGSGQLSAGLMYLYKTISVQGAASFPLDRNTSFRDMDDGKRLSIGVGVSF